MQSVYSFLKKKMDSQKYVSRLENNIIKLKKYFQKWILQWDNNRKHKSNVSMKSYIKNKMSPDIPDLIPIENAWET